MNLLISIQYEGVALYSSLANFQGHYKKFLNINKQGSDYHQPGDLYQAGRWSHARQVTSDININQLVLTVTLT